MGIDGNILRMQLNKSLLLTTMTTESPFLVWREVFAVGHQELDAEHMRLVDAINEIHFAECTKWTSDQLKSLLNALLVTIERHFEHEGSVLRKISDDVSASQASPVAFLKAMIDRVIEEHILEHERALSELKSIIGAVGPEIPAGQKLSHRLKGWFVIHAIKYDAHLKAVFQAM